MTTLSPSSAARRMACPGSRALEERYPRQSSAKTEEGSIAHDVAIHAVAERNELLIEDRKIIEIPKEKVTLEMLEGAIQLNYAITTTISGEHIYKIHLEKPIDISVIHSRCRGIPDIFFNTATTLHIFEYKFGRTPVEVFENWQMIEYAAGILDFLRSRGDLNIYEVQFHIVQPRAFHPEGTHRVWTTTVPRLEFYFTDLKYAEYKSMEPDAPCFTSPECNYCSARHVCPTLKYSTQKIAETSTEEDAFDLTPEKVGEELQTLHDAAGLLKARITGLEAQAFAMLQRGDRVTGYQLDSGRGRNVWNVPPETVVLLGELLNVDLKKSLNVVTPNQAIEAGVPEQLVAQYTEKITGALKLTKINEKNLRRIFNEKDS